PVERVLPVQDPAAGRSPLVERAKRATSGVAYSHRHAGRALVPRGDPDVDVVGVAHRDGRRPSVAVAVLATAAQRRTPAASWTTERGVIDAPFAWGRCRAGGRARR